MEILGRESLSSLAYILKDDDKHQLAAGLESAYILGLKRALELAVSKSFRVSALKREIAECETLCKAGEEVFC